MATRKPVRRKIDERLLKVITAGELQREREDEIREDWEDEIVLSDIPEETELEDDGEERPAE